MNHGKQAMHLVGKNPQYATACGNRGNHSLSTRDFAQVECERCKRNAAYIRWAEKQAEEPIDTTGWVAMEWDWQAELAAIRAHRASR